jgi:hypothetical protein
MYMSLRIVRLDYNKETLAKKLHRLTDQVFRLLPAREEGEDWMKPLETIIIEISGLFNLIDDSQVGLTVISKLEGLRQQGVEVAFPLYRRTILECCALLSGLEQQTLEE